MSEQCVVGVFQSFDRAKDAIVALEKSEFPSEQISLVTHSVEDEVPRQEEAAMQYGDESPPDAARGAGVGGLVGVLLGTPLLMIEGVGALLIAGPIGIGLAGAIVGGFLGAMAGWGVHKDHVAEYEAKVQKGAILIVANGDPKQVAEAQRVLKESDAESVDLHAKTSADEVSP